MHLLPITRLEGRCMVYRMPPESNPPPSPAGFRALLHAPGETTIVQDAGFPAPADASAASGPWALLAVEGPIPHDATGILAGISATLAGAGIPIFALSTFDTDYILVPEDRAERALRSLADQGYPVTPAP